MLRGKSHRGFSRGRGLGSHPPWLKGKEIGLYYRDKAKHNNRRNEVATNTIKLNINVERRIRSLIDFKAGPYAKQMSLTGKKFENMYMHINDSQFKQKFLRIISGNMQENLIKSILTKSKLEKNESLDKKLLQEHSTKTMTKQYTNMLTFRTKLPAYNQRHEILDLLKQHQVILISGETGISLF